MMGIILKTFIYPQTLFSTEPINDIVREIALTDPAVALLLSLLIAAIAALAWTVVKLWKKVDAKNEKLYMDAKTDFKLVLAFESKLDSILEKANVNTQDNTEIKLMIREILFKSNQQNS